jgi:type II secretion system protein G
MRKQSGFTLIELLVVVAIIGVLAAIAIPLMMNAIERARQTKTMERLMELGKFTEQYIMDHNNVGSPKVGSDMLALQQVFREVEINFHKAALHDGWNAMIILETEAAIGGRGYTFMSYGSDSQPGPATDEPGIVKHFEEDIIWSGGGFTQSPEGLQMTKK